MKHLLLLVSSIFLIASCTTMSRRECETADWNKVGYRDALAGWRATDAFKRRSNDCSEHGTKANKDEYASGYVAGLKIFCTYESGIEFGHSGASYRDQCPKQLETEFLKGYRLGMAEHERDQFKKALDAAQEENATLEREKEKLKREKED